MKKGHLLPQQVMLLLLLCWVGSPSLYAQEVTYSCVCLGSSVGGDCGNNAVEGENGEVHTGVAGSTLLELYAPDRLGEQATGWACLVEGTYSCECVDAFCGNNAVGGDNGNVKVDLSTANVIASYGPDRFGAERTGWKCRLAALDAGSTATEELSEAPASRFHSAVYPNPTNARASYALSVAEAQQVQVRVYDMRGRLVGVLHEGMLRAGETHTFVFEAQHLPTGAYIFRAEGEFFEDTRMAIRVR